MTIVLRVSFGIFIAIAIFFLWYSAAADYGYRAVSGTYTFTSNEERSTLVLKSDRSFQQELSRHGKVERATGTWRRIGESGVAFSKEFLIVAGQEPGADGTAYGKFHKRFGFLVCLILSQYHMLWYGRVDPSPANTVSGTYTGDENGVSASLVLKPDHTFAQAINTHGVTKQATGSWSFGHNGAIVFSKDFLKTSGEALGSDETASAWDPKGSNLQIQIALTSISGVPTYRKNQFF
jgi:hypothetical protein